MLHFKLIAGLGNWGQKYIHTRHNIGFRVVEAFCDVEPGAEAVVPWKEKFGALVAECPLADARVVVMKPCSFMNESGRALQQVAGFYQLRPEECVVVHDDIDLALGALRVKAGGGHGGHNGVRSAIECLGSADIVRLKVGVGRPPAELAVKAAGDEDFIARWVLSRFSAEEEGIVGGIVKQAAQAVRVMCISGLKAAQNEFNKRPDE